MRRLSLAEAIREAITEEMRQNEKVFCIGEDIGIEGGFGGAFGVTQGLSEEFGHQRILDTPIAEAGLAGVAIGAAIMGMRPIADVQYGDFIFIAMDQLINNAAKLRYLSKGKIKIPLVMRIPVGVSGRGTQHAQSLESLFSHIPGLKIVCPSTPYDAKGLLKSAIRDDNPVMVFEHKLLYGAKGRKEALDVSMDVPKEEYLIPIGRADVKREGKNITVVGLLKTVHTALSAAKILKKEGIELEVIDPRTLVPLDEETILESVKKTGKLIIIQEDNLFSGWGAEIVSLVTEKAFDYLDAPPKRIGPPATPVPFAPVMEKYYVPDEEDLIKEVKKIMG